ncbi:MAG: hypothetical protein VX447_04300 [Pseudomonadota bacterium]|uniref:hypothetical protein n=1 Tax=Gallaecimonas pentaromativorans TaxID=584787 RepID=UPI00067EAFDC|nr:hypothetical protein [Gallaecimonas pentaromativorans]MED5523964.1 hypothetical protein [Pseudomonadota bacterium]
MKAAVIVLGLASPLALAQEPLSHFEEVCLGQKDSTRCRDYLIGVVDGVKMQHDTGTANGQDYLDRAKSQRIGGRMEYMRSRLCETPNPDKDKLLKELRTEINDAGIQSEQDLLTYLNKAFSCQ